MKEILQLIAGKTDKGRDINRTAVLCGIIYLVSQFKDVPDDLKDVQARLGRVEARLGITTNTSAPAEPTSASPITHTNLATIKP